MPLAKPGRRDEAGFTLLELTMALGLAAFAFAALAATLIGSMKILSVQKTRIRANEVATQGIEDLQRFSYDGLGVCASASASPPSGLEEPVLLPNCPSPASTTYGENPCNVISNAPAVPMATYSCTMLGIPYAVSRYVAWNDVGHTSKHLAVFVDWTDTVGHHQVAQQSSIRSPSVASIIGLSSPVLSSPAVSPSTVVTNNGAPQSTISFSVNASGLSSSDKVFATFTTIDGSGSPETQSLFLTSATGSTWTGTVTSADGYDFGAGSQFIAFAAIRASDGKANAIFTSGTEKFCTTSDPTCASTALPTFSGSPTVPTTVAINPDGSLKADLNVSVTTTNITSTDNVAVSLQAVSGLFSVFLQVDTSQPCSTTSCVWKGTVSTSAGYRFAGGSQKLYFTAEQDVSTDQTSVDKGSTVATASSTVNFT